MTHSRAIWLVCENTGYEASEVNSGDDAQTLDLWDSIAHVNIILAVELAIERPITSLEVIELTSVAGIQNLLDKAGNNRA